MSNNGKLLLRALGAVLLVLAFVNFSPVVSTALVGSSAVEQGLPEQEAETLPNELAEDIGGPTQLTGIPTYFLALVMALTAVGVLVGNRTAVVGAIATLVTDVVLKSIIVIAEWLVGTPVIDTSISLILIAVNFAVIWMLVQARREMKSPAAHDTTHISRQPLSMPE